MKSHRRYRLMALLLAGGAVFQTGATCSDESVNILTTSLVPTLTSALTTAITDGSTCGSSSSTDAAASGSASSTGSGAYSTVNSSIDGLQSNLGLPTAESLGLSSAQTDQ